MQFFVGYFNGGLRQANKVQRSVSLPQGHYKGKYDTRFLVGWFIKKFLLSRVNILNIS